MSYGSSSPRGTEKQVIDGALRAILSAGGISGETGDIFGEIFKPLADLLRFHEALVRISDAD